MADWTHTGQSAHVLLPLDDDDLGGVSGGFEELLEPEYPAVSRTDKCCKRYFLARGKKSNGTCENCFYFHPVEGDLGFCSR